MSRTRKSTQSGHAIMEFGLVAMPLVFFMLGVTVVGFNLGRAVQVAQVSRDATSMFVRGIDFSLTGNQAVLIRLGQKLGMAAGSGTGVIILSKVTWVSDLDCEAIPNCNARQHVVVQRIVIGNSALRASALGTPDSNLLDAKGQVLNYKTEPSAIITLPDIQLLQNEYAYVAETYFSSPDLSFPGFATNTGNYTRSIF